jgi:hypothetical protein
MGENAESKTGKRRLLILRGGDSGQEQAFCWVPV